MRVAVVGVLLGCATVGLTSPQQVGEGQPGFFSGISGAFNNIFGSTNGRPTQRRPAPQQQFQQQQQQQFVPQQQQQQTFTQNQPSFQQAPQQQQQQFQPQTTTFTQAAAAPAPQFRPQPAQQPQIIRQPVASQPSAQRVTGGTALCAAQPPNHFWTDPRDNVRRGYVATWKFGCASFQQGDAKEYCQSMGMEPVSLDSPAKQDEFNRLIAQDAQRFFWTGGIVDHAQKTVFWSNPAGQPVPFANSLHWSPTGGAKLPQPDNRAQGEEGIPEACLGILNNFYADGIKWHDVACYHKKPTVCEPRS